MENAKSLDDNYFIRNAILCFLHHYPEHKWVPIYEELAKRETYVTKSNPRPARRAKKTTNE